MRGTLRTALALAVLALTARARAQDATGDTTAQSAAPQDPAPDQATGDQGTAAPETAPEPVGTAAPATQPALPPAPPVMVAVIATGRVPPETVDAVRSTIVAQVEPMAGGRPVLPLMAAELSAALAACADAPCVGGQVAGAGAIGAIIARLARRAARGPIEVRIEMVDPVSGALRAPPIVYSLTAEGPAIADAIAPLIQQLRAAMFSPPPPPPQILVTVNVDGATVRIDDDVIGESPVASRIVPPGRHVITVQRTGYSGVRREVDVDLGENERVDITLSAAIGAIADEGGGGGAPGAAAEQQWYENWVIWAGIGGGVVVVGVVVGVAVAVASRPQTTPDPSGIPLPPIQ